MRHLPFPSTNSGYLESIQRFKTMNTMNAKQRRRVVLIPLPFQGHLNPMLQLATALHNHSKGALSIIIVHTEFNSPNPSNYPYFTFLPISNGISSSLSNVHVEDVPTLLGFINETSVLPFRDCLVNKILSQQDEPAVSCIISDAWVYFTQPVADDLQLIPRLVLRTGSAMILSTWSALSLLRKKGYLPIRESKLRAPVPELPPLKVWDLDFFSTNIIDVMYEFIIIMVNQTKASSGLILNSYESLEHSELERVRKKFHVPIFTIGPFHKWALGSSSSLWEENDSCLSWLNTQAPSSVIYMSFGSIATLDEAQFIEVALGIANSEQPFLWVIRPGSVKRISTSADNDDFTELLPQEISEMVQTQSGRECIVKWAPQKEVLAHPAVGGFWTHNGWNSTLESICEGVPMLCFPSFGNQIVNVRCVSEVWKVGFYLANRLERGEIETCRRKLMGKGDTKEREEMMTNARDLKEKAKSCLRKEGSSYRSLESLT